MKIPGFNSNQYQDRYVMNKKKKSNGGGVIPFSEEAYGAQLSHKKKNPQVRALERDKSDYFRKTMAHEGTREDPNPAELAPHERYKNAHSLKNGGRGVTSRTSRKNVSTLAIGHGKAGNAQSRGKVSMKNIESTGDIDIDRKPSRRLYVQKSTINLAPNLPEPYYMKNIHAKKETTSSTWRN